MNKDFFVVANKLKVIVKVFNIILSISFRSIPGLVNKVFNRAALAFLYCLFIKQMVYLKRFGGISITVNKYDGGYARMRAIVGVIGWG